MHRFHETGPSKDGEKNILVMTDAFPKFSVADIMPNQQEKNCSQSPDIKVVLHLQNTNKNTLQPGQKFQQ